MSRAQDGYENENQDMLWRRFRQGDCGASEGLFNGLYQRLVLVIRRNVEGIKPNDVEDIIQNVLAAILKAAANLGPDRCPMGYILRITLNQCADYIKRRSYWRDRRMGALEEDVPDRSDNVPVEPGGPGFEFDLRRACLDSLVNNPETPPARREVYRIMLRALDGKAPWPSVKQLAETWNCSVNAVKSRCHDAREHFRKSIDETRRELERGGDL